MVCESMCQRGDGLAAPSASCALALQLLEHTEMCCLCGLCAVCVDCVLFVWVQCFQTLTQLWDLPMSHYGRTQQCCYTIDFD